MATKKKSGKSSKRKTSEKILQAQANKKELLSFGQISKMTYTELGKALTKGTVTEKWLKSYYASARRKAMSRSARVSKTNEFGPVEDQYFRKTRNLTTTSALLHELADVNRYLGGSSSTIKGLRQRRDKQLASLQRHGFNFVDQSNYGDWVRFMQWFQSSEYAAYYDSNDDEVAEVFDAAEQASPKEWAALFESYVSSGVNGNEGPERR